MQKTGARAEGVINTRHIDPEYDFVVLCSRAGAAIIAQNRAAQITPGRGSASSLTAKSLRCPSAEARVDSKAMGASNWRAETEAEEDGSRN